MTAKTCSLPAAHWQAFYRSIPASTLKHHSIPANVMPMLLAEVSVEIGRAQERIQQLKAAKKGTSQIQQHIEQAQGLSSWLLEQLA